MTTPLRFEQDLPMLLDELYVTGTPDYRDDLVRRIAATRQRPAWTFPERWLPMEISTQAVPTARMPWRALGVLTLIAVLIAASIAVYIGSRPRPPDPFGLAANGQLAYAEGGDVFVRDDPTAPPRAIISGPEDETYALHSPLGDRLAVFRAVDGGEELWVADADGSDLVRLGGPYMNGTWVEWSPDQSTIAISYDRQGIPAIDLVATDGSGARRLTDFPAMNPTFRPPDGAQLLFRGQQQPPGWALYLLDVEGGEPVRLAIEGDGIEGGGYDLQRVAWSPTGDRIAYESLVALPDSQLATPGLRIHTASIGPDGEVSDLKRLEFDPRADDELYPTFTPDGTQLIYQQRYGWTPPAPETGIPTVDTLMIGPAGGDGPAQSLGVVSEPGNGFNAAVAPDGTSVIVHLFAEGEDWLVDTVARTATRLESASVNGVSWQRRTPVASP